MEVLEKSMGGWAFYPFLLLIGIVVARIIYNIAVGLPQSGNSFPITAVTLVAAVSSLLIGKGKVMDRVDAFSKGAADSTAMLMVFIMLLSGAFTSVSSEMGGIDLLTNFLLHFIPQNMIYAGILLVTSIISLSIGTSVGSVTAMAPIAAGLAAQAGLNLPLAISAVLGGASLGDNLSFVSDTTIAATRSQNVGIREKFNFNAKLVLPAFIVAVAGTNMMIVLMTGVCFSAVIGFGFGTLNIISFMDAVQSGMTRMTSTIFTAILVKGIMGVVEHNGGVEWLIRRLTSNVKSAKGAQYSVALLTFCLGALIRSTSAIIVAGPLAKEICEPFEAEFHGKPSCAGSRCTSHPAKVRRRIWHP